MIVSRATYTMRLGLWYINHVISICPALNFKGWQNHSVEGLSYDMVDLMLIHNFMVWVYGGVNGH